MGIVLVLAMVMGQSVISVRAGIVNASEGAVFMDGQPVSKKFGTFPSLREGSDLYTQEGRAELQLAADVFLRVGTNSAVRMVSNSLSDTQIRILNGSAIFDSGNAPATGSVTLLTADAKIRIDAPSRMRVDADPPQIRVGKGEARVERNGAATVVHADQVLPLAGDSVVRRMTDGNDDALDLWSLDRNRAIFLSLSTSQGLLDPGTDPDPTAPVDLSAYLGYLPYYPYPVYYPTVQPLRTITPVYGYGNYSGYGVYSTYRSPVYVPSYLYGGYRPVYSARPSYTPLPARPPVLPARPVAPLPHPAVHHIPHH
jgi:hypothetical protein